MVAGAAPSRDDRPPGEPPGDTSEVSRRLARVARGVVLAASAGFLALLLAAASRTGASLAPSSLLLYGVFALACALLAWCAVRLAAGARVILAVLLVAGSATLWVTEIGLALADVARPQRVQALIEARTGVPVDSRTLPEVVRDLRNQGTNAVPSIVPGVILQQSRADSPARTKWTSSLFPLGGISNRPTIQLCNEDGQFKQYVSDEYGFSNPPSAHSAQGIEVALIGDSFTHGYCVNPDQTYAALLRATWPSLLNLGTGGSGPLVELATLTEYAAPLTPRFVVWQYFENDLEDLSLERDHSVLLQYRNRTFSQQLRSRQQEIDVEIGRWIDRMWAAGRGDGFTATFSWRSAAGLNRIRERARTLLERPPTIEPDLPLLREILAEAAARVESWGGRMVFVFIPDWHRYFRPDRTLGRASGQDIVDIAVGLGLRVVDLDPVLRSHPDIARLFARQELATAHFSPAGHALVAQSIAKALGDTRALGHPRRPEP